MSTPQGWVIKSYYQRKIAAFILRQIEDDFHPKWTLRSWQRNYLRGTVFLFLTSFLYDVLVWRRKIWCEPFGDHQVSVQNQALLIRHSFTCGIWNMPFFESAEKAKKNQGKMATLSDNLSDFCTKCIIYHLGKSERNYVRKNRKLLHIWKWHFAGKKPINMYQKYGQ